MAAVRLLLANNDGKPGQGIIPRVINRVIVIVTRKPTTHVAIEVDGVVFESQHDSGVHSLPFHEWEKRHHAFDAMDLPGIDGEELIRRAEELNGRMYDIRAIFSHLFNRDFQDPAKENCTEFLGHLLSEWVHDSVALWRITPGEFRGMACAYRHGYENGKRDA